MWVPVAVWQPCELLYTCYLLTNSYATAIILYRLSEISTYIKNDWNRHSVPNICCLAASLSDVAICILQADTFVLVMMRTKSKNTFLCCCVFLVSCVMTTLWLQRKNVITGNTQSKGMESYCCCILIICDITRNFYCIISFQTLSVVNKQLPSVSCLLTSSLSADFQSRRRRCHISSVWLFARHCVKRDDCFCDILIVNECFVTTAECETVADVNSADDHIATSFIVIKYVCIYCRHVAPVSWEIYIYIADEVRLIFLKIIYWTDIIGIVFTTTDNKHLCIVNTFF